MPKIWDITVRAPSGWWVIDDKSGAKLESNSYRNLKFAIISHRKANNLEWLDKEIDDMIHRQVCARERPEYCQDFNSKTKFNKKTNAASRWGPAKWAELHKLALSGGLNAQSYKAWRSGLPNAGCSCRAHFNQIIDKNPMPLTFEGTVWVHNEVNKRLGKPQMTVEQARDRWK